MEKVFCRGAGVTPSWQGCDAQDWLGSTSTRDINFKNLDKDGNGLFEVADLMRQVSELEGPAPQVQIGLGKMPAGTYSAGVFCENGGVLKKFVVAR